MLSHNAGSKLRCKACGKEYKKKDILLNGGKVIDHTTCICLSCEHRSAHQSPSINFNKIILAILCLILFSLCTATFFIYQAYDKQQKQKELEDEVCFQLFNKSADFTLELRDMKNKYALQEKFIELQKEILKPNDSDDYYVSMSKFHKQRKLNQMELDICLSQAQDLRKASEKLLAAYLEEVKKLHPDKADEIDAKVKLLMKKRSPESQKELQKMLKKYFKALNFDKVKKARKPAVQLL